MRALICVCLASGLLAGEGPQPGRDQAFLSRILADTESGSRPWKTFRTPVESGSAVVEVVGELTREELRQVAFQEFLSWFRMDFQRFIYRHGEPAPVPASLASATLPIDRFGGNPLPRNVPMGRAYF